MERASVLNGSTRLGSVQRMPITLENVGIAVRDIEAAIAFFTDLGLTVVGRDTVRGEWADTAVGLDGNHAHIAMLQPLTSTPSFFRVHRSSNFALLAILRTFGLRRIRTMR